MPAVLRAAFLALLLVGGTAQAAPDPGRIDRAAERVLDERFQESPTGTSDDFDREELEQRLRDHESRGGGGWGGGSSSPGGAGALSPIVSMLMWALLIAGAVVVIFYVVRELGRGRRDRVRASDPAIAEEPVPHVAQLEGPLADADALAAQGKFAEAIHTLLLRTFQELAKASASHVSPHLTSREILARIPMLGDGRDALGELVAVVEVTWFGDDVPGEADWLRCRAQFDRFVSVHRASLPTRVEAAA